MNEVAKLLHDVEQNHLMTLDNCATSGGVLPPQSRELLQSVEFVLDLLHQLPSASSSMDQDAHEKAQLQALEVLKRLTRPCLSRQFCHLTASAMVPVAVKVLPPSSLQCTTQTAPAAPAPAPAAGSESTGAVEIHLDPLGASSSSERNAVVGSKLKLKRQVSFSACSYRLEAILRPFLKSLETLRIAVPIATDSLESKVLESSSAQPHPEVSMSVLQELVAITQEICADSMTTTEALIVFETLRVSQRPARKLVLDMMLQLLDNEDAPRAIFAMKGFHAGIIAPASQTLFPKKGYTLSFGIFLNPGQTMVPLYSFRGSNGQGISAVLEENCLVLRTFVMGGSIQELKIFIDEDRRRMEQQWVHVCVVHAKKMVFKDKIVVFLDKTKVFNGNLAYPDPLCMIGGQHSIGTMPNMTSLQGSLWCPTLFGQALSDQEVDRLHWKSHWKNDLNFAAAENAGLNDKSKFIFCYDARSSDQEKRLCYDVSGNDCHGWLEPGTMPVQTQGFLQSLDSIGGSGCFLLLLLDQIPEMADFHPEHELSMEETSRLLLFVATGLQKSISCRSHFVRLHGVQVLGFVLQSISPAYLSVELLDAVAMILEALLSVLTGADVSNCLCLLFFSNTNWFFSPFETQKKLFEVVLPACLKLLRKESKSIDSLAEEELETVDVNFFCNLLVQIYLPKPENHDALAANIAQMDANQLQTLRLLIIERLIDPLLFQQDDPEACLGQWKQLFAHICRRCATSTTPSSSNADETTSAQSSLCEIAEILRYLAHILNLRPSSGSSSGAASSPPANAARQLMVSKVLKVSHATLRIWWRPLLCKNASVRVEALRVLECYTFERVTMQKKDLLVLYNGLSDYPLDLPSAELLLDVVIGRKQPSSANAGSTQRFLNLARIDLAPLLLIGLADQADPVIQTTILFEINKQLEISPTADSLKESIRCWPSWMGRLRRIIMNALDVSVQLEQEDTNNTATNYGKMSDEKLNRVCALLSDENAAMGARLEAIVAIQEEKDPRVCDLMVSVFQSTCQVLRNAIVELFVNVFPNKTPFLVVKIANHILVEVLVYSLLHVRSGWMHFQEFVFYHYERPSQLCFLAVAICERFWFRLSQKVQSFGSSESSFVWENVSQVAAITSQMALLVEYAQCASTKPIRAERMLLSESQQRLLCRQAWRLWSLLIPKLPLINWDDSQSNLAKNAMFGTDVPPEDTAIFSNLFADCKQVKSLVFQVALEEFGFVQQESDTHDEQVEELRKTMIALQVLLPPRAISGNAHGLLRNENKEANDPSDTKDWRNVLGKELLYSHLLDQLFTFLTKETSKETRFHSSYTLMRMMVMFATLLLHFKSDQVHEQDQHSNEVTKTLQIISSTDISFYSDIKQLTELVTLWGLHRELLGSFCDANKLDQLAASMHERCFSRWKYVIEQHPMDFNPYMIQQEVAFYAELLGQELSASEALWKDIIDKNMTDVAALAAKTEVDVRNLRLKRDAERFAGSVHKLILQTVRGERSMSAGDDPPAASTPTPAPSQPPVKQEVPRRRPPRRGVSMAVDGLLVKIDTKENGYRMRLMLKRVREDYRLRNLSCDLSVTVSDVESQGSARYKRFLSQSSHGHGMETGSEYNDFFADAQMRAAIIHAAACSPANAESFESLESPDLEDEDDLGEEIFANEDESQSLFEREVAAVELDKPLELESSIEETRDAGAGVVAQHTETPSPTLFPPPPIEISAPVPAPVKTPVQTPPRLPIESFLSGFAGMVQKAAQDAKDAMNLGVDHLYIAKDALTDEASSLMQEVTTLLEVNPNSTKSSSAPSSSPPSTEPSTSVPKEGEEEEEAAAVANSPIKQASRSKSPEVGKDKDLPISKEIPGSSSNSSVAQAPSEKKGEPAKVIKLPSKSDVIEIDAKLVRHMHVTSGKLGISSTWLFFIPEKVIDEQDNVLMERKKGLRVKEHWRFLFKRRKWKLDDIATLHRRRFLLKPTALEFFIHSTRKNFFFNVNADDIGPFHEALMAHRPLLLRRDPAMRRLRHPSSSFRCSSMSNRWVNHEISTFEYLMWLNTIAGRTYNDLTQYPVFPWVLADYKSPQLDLSRERTFRDLSKPVGALEPSRMKFFVDRYKSFDDPDIPPFLYGTHYSNIGVVLFYLIRLEPFTTYAMNVQGGKLDHADRLFHSVAETWHNCLTDFTDVKELTPEWFYLPEFLVNCNNVELGTRQSGVELGDVVLPPWAQSSEDFVMKNLLALESEYVSSHIHHWIDLVFGFQQRGQAAIDANNVFFYLTYEGAVDVDSITDPIVKASMRAQIAHFGQTPSQVLREHQPVRMPLAAMLKPSAPESIVNGCALVCLDSTGMATSHRVGVKMTKSHQVPVITDFGSTPLSAPSKSASNGPLPSAVSMSSNAFKSPMSVQDPPERDYIDVQDRKPKRIASERAMRELIAATGKSIAFLNNGSSYCTTGHHDFSARFYSSNDGSLLYRLLQHNNVVSCLGVSTFGSVIALGCQDGTISVWKVAQLSPKFLDALKLFRSQKAGDDNSKPVHAKDYAADQVLLGHNSSINCVAVSQELSVCVSGSNSNECIAHNLDDGSILRHYEIDGSKAPGVTALALSLVGHLIVHSLGTGSAMLYSFHFNGKLLAKVPLDQPMLSISVSGRHARVFLSNRDQVLIMEPHSLDQKHVLFRKEKFGEVYCQALAADETHVVFAVGNGKLLCYRLVSSASWTRLQD